MFLVCAQAQKCFEFSSPCLRKSYVHELTNGHAAYLLDIVIQKELI
jgi:hypothetical protein